MRKINWKRYYCERGGSISLNDDGFMQDPEGAAFFYHKGVVSFQEIEQKSCLILLGEPGIGKTTTVQDEVEILREKINTPRTRIINKDLKEYGDENRLINDIFKSNSFKEWLSDESILYLFLDSLDESAHFLKNISIIIKNQLTHLQHFHNRLFLRIVCRSGEWPENIEQTCINIWGKNNVGIYELAPLRRQDVILAAEDKEYCEDVTSFMTAILQQNLQPLAIYPLTLFLLLKLFKNHKEFPHNKTDLFYKGCYTLCEECNQDRIASGIVKTISVEKQMVLAGRIAALMIFSNKSVIKLHNGIDSDIRNTLSLADIQEGEEKTEKYPFAFSQENICEVVRQTALFSIKGDNTFQFIHETFKAYLAAFYVHSRDLNLQQLKSLLQLSNDPDERVAPQLREVFSWLCYLILKYLRRK